MDSKMSEYNPGDTVSWKIVPDSPAERLRGYVLRVYPNGNGVYRGLQHAFMMVRVRIPIDKYIDIEHIDYAVPLNNPSIQREL